MTFKNFGLFCDFQKQRIYIHIKNNDFLFPSTVLVIYIIKPVIYNWISIIFLRGEFT